ncbi:phage tail tape measure protein [Streptomyces sp. RPT161]|uniref:phage tail tape measure protein n=1 Tax=Streptomyces sp. RPT161 TaxID=3015993 RepID=UPI0022B8A75D|nr:phage tail tape measure protein [Streptomyces sp. RPT161]
MAGAEMFTVMAVIEARDKISATLEKAEAHVDQFTNSLQRMAGVSEESGARVDESLLQTASGADALDLASARVEATQAKLAAATREQAVAEQELIDVQRQVAAGELDAAEAADKQAAAYARLQAAERDAAAAGKELGTAQKLQADTAEAAAAKTDAASVSQGRFSGAMARGSSLMAGATKAAAYTGVAVAAIGYESVKAATSFQTLTTQLVTTAGEAPSALKQVQDGILNISNQTATSANSLAQSMYVVEASGYNAAHGGLDVLKAATEGARLENSDFKTVANGVTDILKDYHKGAGDAANMTSQLVVAVGHGKANFQQFSAALSNILPMGSAVGLKFNDLAGVLAEMTSHGVTAQRASQNMANAMRSLENPTSVMTKEFKAVGINAQDVQKHLSSQGLGGTMQWLSGLAKDNAARLGQTYPAALAKLMGTSAGLSVALMTTGENARDTNKAIKDIGQASADSKGNVQGFAQVQQTLGFKMDQAKQAIHNTGIALGTALLPMVTRVMEAVNKILVPIATWIQNHQKLAGSILTVVGATSGLILAVVGVVKAINLVQGAFKLLAANPVVAAITLIVIALIYAYSHFKAFRDVVNEVAKFLGGVFAQAWHAIGAVISWFSKNVMPEVRKVIQDVFNWFQAHKQVFVDAWNDVVKAVDGLVKWFKTNVLDWVKARVAELVDWWHQHSAQIKEIWDALWAAAKTVVKVWWDGYMRPTLSVIKSVWTTVWDAIRDALKVVWAAISGIVTTAIHLVENTISLVLDVITGKWGRVWGDLKRLVGQALHDMVSTITSIASGFGDLLWDAGANIIKGLINGIRSMIGGVGNAIGDVVNEVKSFLPWSPAKKGPLSGNGSPAIGGRNIVRQMAQGMTSGTGYVQAAMATVTGAAARGVVPAGLSPSGFSYGTPGLVGAGAGGGSTIVQNFDFRQAHVMSERDMDQLVNKIGTRVATTLLPAGGVRIRG